MTKPFLIAVMLLSSNAVVVSGFTMPRGSFGCASSTTSIRTTPTILFSSPPPPKRIARRDLKKRRNKGQRQSRSRGVEDVIVSNTSAILETRPLVRSISVEAGEDYWIDEDDLRKSLERQQAIKNRKIMEGEIPKEKLQMRL